MYVIFSRFFSSFKVLLFGVAFIIYNFSIYFMYILLFSIARNIVLMVLIISHGYSFPLSKLFCLKCSLNLRERWGGPQKVVHPTRSPLQE